MLAVRLPARVNSDHLTLLALTAMFGAGLSSARGRQPVVGLMLVIVCLALNWFGDSLDNTVARVRQQQQPRYMEAVDHVVDAFGALFLFGGLALSGFMTPWVAGVLARLLHALPRGVRGTHVASGRVQLSFFKMGPTELRILRAIGNIAVLWRPMPVIAGHAFKLFDVGGVIGAAGLFLTLVYSAVRNTRALYRAEPIPPPQK